MLCAQTQRGKTDINSFTHRIVCANERVAEQMAYEERIVDQMTTIREKFLEVFCFFRVKRFRLSIVYRLVGMKAGQFMQNL